MLNLKLLIREPAMVIDAVETALVLLVAFGLGLSGDQQSYIVAAVIAGLGLLKAFKTHPFPVTMLTDFGRAALVLAVSFGLHVSADQLAVAVTFLGTLTTLIVRGQVTPVNDPVFAPSGAGSGPVATGTDGKALP